MKSWQVHYLNKYPGGHVQASESALDVYDRDGQHRVALRKDGGGSWVDMSEAEGCPDRHDLSPIPKESRVHKIQKGCVGKDEKADQRLKSRSEFDRDGKIPSCEELEKEGYAFEKDFSVKARPQKILASAE